MAKDGQQKQLLIDKFKQKQASRLDEVEESTKLVLTQLRETLTQHVSDELATTKATISQQSSAISSLLSSQNQALETQTEALSSHGQTLDRMKSLTQSETSLIKQSLMEALREIQSEATTAQKQMQSQALIDMQEAQSKTLHAVHKMQRDLINSSIAPLKASMTQVLKEGEALHRMTFRAWLKPLWMGGGFFLGCVLVSFTGVKAMDWLYTSRLDQLATIKAEITEGKAVLKSLPSGIIYTENDGTKYILAKKIGEAFTPAGDAYNGKMAVAVETK